MAVLDYRTNDGFDTYGFSIEYLPDIGWRVYIIFVPSGCDLQSPYQSVDGEGHRYVDWPSRLENLGDARQVAALWAEIDQRYQRIQAERVASFREAGIVAGNWAEHVQYGPERINDGAIMHRTRFGEHDLAVLDVSLEVSTVNWTACVPAGGFVSEIDRIAHLDETDRVIIQASTESQAYEITVPLLRRLVRDENFDMACNFIRIDLSPTLSVAWQILPGMGSGLRVVGMGEETGRVAAGASRKLLEELLGTTATSKINSQTVIDLLALLVRPHYGGSVIPYPSVSREGRGKIQHERQSKETSA
jgi:hypothetical protein